MPDECGLSGDTPSDIEIGDDFLKKVILNE